MALYPGQPGWAGTRTLRNINPNTTFAVLKFLTSTPNLRCQVSQSTSTLLY